MAMFNSSLRRMFTHALVYTLAFAFVTLWGSLIFRLVYVHALFTALRGSHPGQYISADPALISGLDQEDVGYVYHRFNSYFSTRNQPQGAVDVIRLAARRRTEGLMGKFQLDQDSISAYVSDKQRLAINATRFLHLWTTVVSSATLDPPASGEAAALQGRLETSDLPEMLRAPPFSLAQWWPPAEAELDNLAVYEARLQFEVGRNPPGSTYYVLLDERTGCGYLMAY